MSVCVLPVYMSFANRSTVHVYNKKTFVKNKMELENLLGENKGRGPFRCSEKKFVIFLP